MGVALPPPPPRIAKLPRNELGYPVPWFVEWIDGEPDFRIADSRKKILALQRDLCWVCGEKLGAYKAFTIGPMCAINRVSAKPPEHRECAVYSAIACPFLTIPARRRIERGIPKGAASPAGLMIRRNPGVALVWVTRAFRPFRDEETGGVLFRIGDPTEALWFCEGRAATRAEVDESIRTGLPLHLEVAEQEGSGAVEELEIMRVAAEAYLPPSSSPPTSSQHTHHHVAAPLAARGRGSG